jgi:hypothetical protein
MSDDRKILQWGLPFVILIVGISLAVFVILFPHTKTVTVTKTVAVEHVGLHLLKDRSTQADYADYGLTMTCEDWGSKGFNPDTDEPAAGQRLIRDCQLTKTGPVG